MVLIVSDCCKTLMLLARMNRAVLEHIEKHESYGNPVFTMFPWKYLFELILLFHRAFYFTDSLILNNGLIYTLMLV